VISIAGVERVGQICIVRAPDKLSYVTASPPGAVTIRPAASIVIVPAAVLIFGLGFIREARFPLWLRVLPLATLATLVALWAAVGLVAVLETGEDVFLFGAMLAVLAAVAAFGRGVTRTTSR